MLPDMDGLDVCRQIRRRGGIPILMLTARGDAMDRIVGLEMGADDYLPKPFEPRELLARVRAILRRQARGIAESILRFGRLEIDLRCPRGPPDRRAVSAHQSSIRAIAGAWRDHAGHVMSREALMDIMRNEPLEAFDRSIDVHISRIRAAIEDEVTAGRAASSPSVAPATYSPRRRTEPGDEASLPPVLSDHYRQPARRRGLWPVPPMAVRAQRDAESIALSRSPASWWRRIWPPLGAPAPAHSSRPSTACMTRLDVDLGLFDADRRALAAAGDPCRARPPARAGLGLWP